MVYPGRPTRIICNNILVSLGQLIMFKLWKIHLLWWAYKYFWIKLGFIQLINALFREVEALDSSPSPLHVQSRVFWRSSHIFLMARRSIQSQQLQRARAKKPRRGRFLLVESAKRLPLKKSRNISTNLVSKTSLITIMSSSNTNYLLW